MYTLIFWGAIIATIFALTQAVYFRTPDDSYSFAHQDKMAMLENTNREPSIVLMGGSSVAFGFNSQMIVDSIGIPVINVGLHAGLGLKFMMDETLPRLRKGDILVFASEISSHLYGDGYYGTDEYVHQLYLHQVPLNEVSVYQMRRVIEQTPSFLLPRVTALNLRDKYSRNLFDKYGDYIGHWTNDSLTHFGAKIPREDDGNALDLDAVHDVITRLKYIQNKGIKVIMFPPPGDKTSWKNITYKFSDVVKIFNSAGFEYPDTLGVDLMENEYTYDTNFHLNKKGATRHTQYLIRWLKQKGISQI